MKTIPEEVIQGAPLSPVLPHPNASLDADAAAAGNGGVTNNSSYNNDNNNSVNNVAAAAGSNFKSFPQPTEPAKPVKRER